MTAEGRPYRVGTLSYTKAGLVALFCWLLTGDVMYVLIDQVQPRLLPVMLKTAGANNQAIAIIVGSFAAFLNFVVTPIVSYRSDRKRGPRGRRIPYLLWATPFVSFFLALTPYAPAIARRALAVPAIASALGGLAWNPVVLSYAAVVFFYQLFEMVVASIYFYLFADVVPASHLGRFLTLFRIFGALATFILNYWLMGLSVTYPHAIYLGLALVNLVGFLALCRFVREGDYPPVAASGTPLPFARIAPLRGAATFFRESFHHPIYRWMQFIAVTLAAPAAMTPFIILFAREELALDLNVTGKLMAWSSFAWIAVAYPFGVMLDRHGSLRLLTFTLWLLGVAGLGSFFFVVGPATFLVSSTLLGLGYWMMMLAALKLIFEIYPPARLGQFASAGSMTRAACLAFLLNPLAGWLFDSFRHFHAQLRMPWAGTVDVGHYRFTFLYIAAFYLLSLLGVAQIRRQWLRLGGPGNYAPPL